VNLFASHVVSLVYGVLALGAATDDGRGGKGLDGQRISDEDLARQIRDGNEPAFEALVHRYHRPLLGYLYRMCHDYHLSEEAAQECFTRFYLTRARYKYPKPLKPYLYAIAANCLKDYLKSAYARRVIVHDPAPGMGSGRVAAESQAPFDVCHGAGDRGDPQDEAVRRLERREVVEAIAQLPYTYREALVLRFYQGLTIREISQALEVPEGTVKSRLFTAVQRLKESIGDGARPCDGPKRTRRGECK
jgi:RNA polymerase sigma factor (sigma-70 family)